MLCVPHVIWLPHVLHMLPHMLCVTPYVTCVTIYMLYMLYMLYVYPICYVYPIVKCVTLLYCYFICYMCHPHMYVCYPICVCYPMLYVLPHVYHSYLFPFCSARCGLVHWLINWFFGLSVAGSYVAQADLNSLGSRGWPPPSEFWDYRQFMQAVVTALGLNRVSMHARQAL